ncbi:MAG: ABC transporter permease [Actinobacteria bacterium]|nr:ABC transporter permease [Actinomycetota bacterium]
MSKFKLNGTVINLAIIFAVVFATFSIIAPNEFLSIKNFQSIAYKIPEFGLLTLAMLLPMIAGGINLSTIASTGMIGVICSKILTTFLSQDSSENTVLIWVIAIVIIAIAISFFSGLFNGIIIGVIGVSPILATLGTLTLYNGVALKTAGGVGSITGFPEKLLWIGNGEVFKIPIPIIIFLIVAVIIFFVTKTSFGIQIYLVGSNPVASRFSGVNNQSILIKSYTISGLLCGIVAIIMMARYNSAKADYGSSYLLQSILAVIMGGTSISGGSGTVLGTVIAIIILQMISSGFNLIGFAGSAYVADIVWGALLIIIIMINYLINNGRLSSIKRSLK